MASPIETELLNALYHNGCICKYFMKTPKETVKEETESSDHDLAYEKLISDIGTSFVVFFVQNT
jgi:hypothetical protein